MNTFLKLLAMAAAAAAITACSGDEHGEGTHEHAEEQPETEAYYGDEQAEPENSTEEASKKEEDTHTHEDGEEHGHH